MCNKTILMFCTFTKSYKGGQHEKKFWDHAYFITLVFRDFKRMWWQQ